MRRQDKELNKKHVALSWRLIIRDRGYFDYWLDYDEVEEIVCYCHPTVSRTFIHSIFWKDIINDKKFLKKYEY